MTTRPRVEPRTPWDCAICLATPEEEVHQCHRGHYYCAGCLAGLPQRRCPLCRVALPEDPIRSLAAEQAIAALPSRCDHCALELTFGQRRSHERSCPQRPAVCEAADDGCGWRGIHADLEAHEAGCRHALCRRVLRGAEARWATERDALRSHIERVEAANRAVEARLRRLEERRVSEEEAQRSRTRALSERVRRLEQQARRVPGVAGRLVPGAVGREQHTHLA